ncbi:MAG: hypothetical protein IJV58_04125, partial [Oscillospiraceae bacterium]|nr:hypothetical protein [Oscillospiraceae bacterium]
MKKIRMILGNALIVLGILLLITLYIVFEQNKHLTEEIETFQTMTVAMENVTTNYLVGEQLVCSSWANYINQSDMTAQEAVAFVRDSIAAP